MQRGFFTGVLCLLASVAAAEPSDSFDAKLGAALERQSLAGAVYALIDGERVVTGAAGFADLPARTAMPPDARVHVGSVAKVLVALGVMQLASGTSPALALDAPVASLVPSLHFPPQREPIRVRHLLDHTAGLDDARLWQVFAPSDPDLPLAQAFTDPGTMLASRATPGRGHSYSNMGYTLAAMVIETVTGERYESYLERALLAPLGMHDTTFRYVEGGGDSRLVAGHGEDGSPLEPLPIALRPASQLTTSAADMGRLARFLLTRHPPIVDDALLAGMASPSGTDAAKAGLRGGYALGFATRDRHGVLARCHSGNTVGFRGQLCIFPEHGKGFFVAVNTDSETADFDAIDALFVDALGIPRVEPASIEASSAEAALRDARPWEGRYAVSPSRFETFRYLDLLGGTIVLSVEDDVLAMRGLGREPRRLHPLGGPLFRADGRVAASHALIDGGIADGFRTYRAIPSAAWYALWGGAIAGVLGVAWFALAVPVRALVGRGSAREPATIAIVLVLLAAASLATLPWYGFATRNAPMIALYATTLALPFAFTWQLHRSGRARRRLDAVAALFALQWLATLYAFGLLPFASWR